MRYKILPKYEVILVAGGIFVVTFITQDYRLDMHHDHFHQESYTYNQPMPGVTQASTISGSLAPGFPSSGIQIPPVVDLDLKVF